MAYSARKSIVKGSVPVGIIILVSAIQAALRKAGVTVDESVVWQVALAGYGAVIAFINWIKNRKK